ncbi:hypothetical protein PMAYCL1PPCAC_17374, partial [Pristionchus mayeri]
DGHQNGHDRVILPFIGMGGDRDRDQAPNRHDNEMSYRNENIHHSESYHQITIPTDRSRVGSCGNPDEYHVREKLYKTLYKSSNYEN